VKAKRQANRRAAKRVQAPRLGIFGGTFDPIHLAHLRCAEEAREALSLDRILFIPSASPPHKNGAFASGADRLAMVRRAITGHPRFRASSIELDRSGRSYSIDTLHALRQRFPEPTKFVFLLGLDAFREIGTWKRYEELFSLADFAVLSRPPYRITSPRALLPVAARRHFCYGPNRRMLVHTSGNRIAFLAVTALDISASNIRQRARRGHSIRYLVPSSVASYLDRHQLYRHGNRSS
jgi:nicotinate-nucleotide adenylyltransferase